MTLRQHQVTELRRQILEALDTYVFLSTPQFYRVIPKRGEGKQDTWERACRRALVLLERAGFITHGAIFDEQTAANHPTNKRWGYFLTPAGAKVLQRTAKTPWYQRKPASLIHEEAISEFHLTVEAALRGFPHLKLHFLRKEIRKGTNPDAILGIEDTTKPRDKSTHWFFLEMEMSRAGNWKDGHDQKVRKAKHYDDYRRSRELTKDWPFIADCRVIFHETTDERMYNLLHKLGKLLPYRFLWVTSREGIIVKGILGKVFYTPKDYTQRSSSIIDCISPSTIPQSGA